ncbi:uncharacterized protein LOC135701882 [Ochlerotatus camptorhynchus]|uniref:uncharacterized protein LOC135701882 n=1 Tax=Ochlerotatus camptorhynchus TaxID=644619 RepID=UPI0031D28A2C
MEQLKKKLDDGSFDKLTEYVRGALRIFKKLFNRGIKRSTNMEHASTDEIFVTPLIRWVQFVGNDVGFDELLAVKQSTTSKFIDPHIVCVANRYKRGNVYVTFNKFIISCGMSAIRAIEVLFKCLPLFGLKAPVLLRKLNDMLSVNVFGTIQSSKCKTVTDLTARYKEFSHNLTNDD